MPLFSKHLVFEPRKVILVKSKGDGLDEKSKHAAR
jgi:hypothetical protein